MCQAFYVDWFIQSAQLRRGCWGVTPAADSRVYMTSCFPGSWRDTGQCVNCWSECQGFPCAISVWASLHPHVTNHQTSVQKLSPLFFTKTTRRVKAMKFIPRFSGIYWIIWCKYKDRYVGVSVSSQRGRGKNQRHVSVPLCCPASPAMCCPCACPFLAVRNPSGMPSGGDV